MPLPGTVAPAPNLALGFDTDAPVTSEEAAARKAAGFVFCVRYLTRVRPEEDPSDLTAAEGERLLDAGLAVSAVQHVAREGWMPNAQLGSLYGANAAANARSVGLPGGMNIWLDLEGVAGGAASSDVAAYCNAWFAELADAGYLPGIYVGANCGLTGDELFFALSTKHYWKSGSTVPDVPHRGYQMIQSISKITGDRNVTQPDGEGGTVMWLQP